MECRYGNVRIREVLPYLYRIDTTDMTVKSVFFADNPHILTSNNIVLNCSVRLVEMSTQDVIYQDGQLGGFKLKTNLVNYFFTQTQK